MSAMISFLVGAIIMILGLISAFILIPKNVKDNKTSVAFNQSRLFVYI